MNLQWLGNLLRGMGAGRRNYRHGPDSPSGVTIPFPISPVPLQTSHLELVHDLIGEDICRSPGGASPRRRGSCQSLWRIWTWRCRGISPDRTGMAQGTLICRTPGGYFGNNTLGAQTYMGPRPVQGHDRN